MDIFSDIAVVDFLGMDSTIRAVLFGGIFLLSLGVTLWVFYYAQQQGQDAWGWKGAAALATLMTLPALVLAAFNLDVSRQGLVNPLSYLALGGGAVTLLNATAYLAVSLQTRGAEIAEPYPLPATPVEETTQIQEREPEPTRIERLAELGHLAFLVEKSGPRAGVIHRLRDRTVLGRDADCDIVFDDDSVSRQHASIRLQDDVFVVRDLDSSNGTWLLDGTGQARIEQPRALQELDRIKVGATTLVFTRVRQGGAPGAASTMGGTS